MALSPAVALVHVPLVSFLCFWLLPGLSLSGCVVHFVRVCLFFFSLGRATCLVHAPFSCFCCRSSVRFVLAVLFSFHPVSCISLCFGFGLLSSFSAAGGEKLIQRLLLPLLVGCSLLPSFGVLSRVVVASLGGGPYRTFVVVLAPIEWHTPPPRSWSCDKRLSPFGDTPPLVWGPPTPCGLLFSRGPLGPL